MKIKILDPKIIDRNILSSSLKTGNLSDIFNDDEMAEIAFNAVNGHNGEALIGLHMYEGGIAWFKYKVLDTGINYHYEYGGVGFPQDHLASNIPEDWSQDSYVWGTLIYKPKKSELH